jgi:hypothetical protein
VGIFAPLLNRNAVGTSRRLDLLSFNHHLAALFHQVPNRSNDQRNVSLTPSILQSHKLSVPSKHDRYGFSEMCQKASLMITATRRGLATLMFSLVIAAVALPRPGFAGDAAAPPAVPAGADTGPVVLRLPA